MKKLILAILLFPAICFADTTTIDTYKTRIADLENKYKVCVQNIQQAQTFIQQTQAEALKIQGAIEVLKELETKEAKPTE